MTKVHKDDLHRETQDEALSVICFTPEPEVVQEETVPKSEYKQLVQSHREEMQMLQDQYEYVLRLLCTFLVLSDAMRITLRYKNVCFHEGLDSPL